MADTRAGGRRCVIAVVLMAALAAYSQTPIWSGPIDDRQGVVATDTSGWGGPVMPMQGPTFFEPISARWWYNYGPDSNGVFPGYCKLYMYWRATTGYTAAQIQAHAAAARAASVWMLASEAPGLHRQYMYSLQ